MRIGTSPHYSSKAFTTKISIIFGRRRAFSQITYHRLRTSELQPDHFQSLRCNSERLWKDIHETAKWGIGRKYGAGRTQTGLSRLTLSDSDKEVRDWFAETAKSLNCDVEVDEIGNMFAIRPGLSKDAPATFAGSHLDSQPAGGRFDGVLGVCAGIEMLRVLNDNWIETEGPVGVVNWTNEEGARFPISMMGSGVWSDPSKLQKTYDTKEVGNGQRTVLEELQRIGYQGELPAAHDKGIQMGGHFELHIEQGPKLETKNKAIGAVRGVQAYKWFEVEVMGKAAHSGATDFEHRADAVYHASKMVYKLRNLVEHQMGLITFGIFKVEPGSINTVPERVFMTMDVRHENDEKLKATLNMVTDYISESECRANKIQAESNGPQFKTTVTEIFDSPAVNFDRTAVDCVKASAKDVLESQDTEIPEMLSGAGHDSVHTSKHCPTAMIFVPCKDGVSHHPEEWCEQKHCAAGTDVLLQSVLRFDQWRHKQGQFA